MADHANEPEDFKAQLDVSHVEHPSQDYAQNVHARFVESLSLFSVLAFLLFVGSSTPSPASRRIIFDSKLRVSALSTASRTRKTYSFGEL